MWFWFCCIIRKFFLRTESGRGPYEPLHSLFLQINVTVTINTGLHSVIQSDILQRCSYKHVHVHGHHETALVQVILETFRKLCQNYILTVKAWNRRKKKSNRVPLFTRPVCVLLFFVQGNWVQRCHRNKLSFKLRSPVLRISGCSLSLRITQIGLTAAY